ncbi:hypothetical protein IV203_019886 [Nitzschia inconspicua]|uniref:Uncharacterized protein n=1 Tax=Nitzschia inconspicua TaxID=303405 RepID=A0A9K3M1R6_9STRA|nr:hypothetical protein IV203_019886 [Nitzschia inconspicua]
MKRTTVTHAVTTTILSWNTLCTRDPWYEGWGCPLEQERRDLLMELEGLSTEQAQAVLTQERYQRIRRALKWEIQQNEGGQGQEEQYKDHESLLNESQERNNSVSTLRLPSTIDIMLFQEVTRDDPWDENDDDTDFVALFSSLYDRVPCQDDSKEETLQQVYVRRDSGWRFTQSYGLKTDVLEGGCLVELEYVDDDFLNGEESDVDGTKNENNLHDAVGGSDSYFNATVSTQGCDDELEKLHWEEQQSQKIICNKMYIVNLHGKSSYMRNPYKLNAGMMALWSEISDLLISTAGDDISLCNDPDLNGDSWKERIVLCGDWNVHLSDLPGIFLNLGNYSDVEAAMLDNRTGSNFSTNHEDGFLAQYDGCLLATSPFLELQSVSRNLTGFMVKGENGALEGRFTCKHNQGVFYEGSLLPGTLASDGLSDHLQTYTTFSISLENRLGL